MNFLAKLWLVTITKPPSLGSSLSFFKKYHINNALNDCSACSSAGGRDFSISWAVSVVLFACFPIDFQWKVLECVQLCIGETMGHVTFIFITLVLSCFMDPNESNHWYQILFSGIFLEAFQDIMFQHLADQQFLPASQRVFRARSPEMALVRSTFKDWQKLRLWLLELKIWQKIPEVDNLK